MFNPKILILLTILLISSSGCIFENTNNITIQEGILTIGVPYDLYPTVYFEDSSPKGFEIDLITEIARRMGLHPKFKIYEFSSLLKAVEKNEIDCAVAFMTITTEREKQVDFSRCYFQTYSTILVRENDSSTELKDLENRKVGVVAGSIHESLMNGFMDDMNFELIPYENIREMHHDLLSGSIDAEIVQEVTSKEFIDLNDPVKAIGGKIDISYIGIPLNDENHALRNEINDVILEMENDGTLVQLKEKWNID
ncbi:polar amino acid transport system substrate-binding protein [Methanococcus maripaludis]|uniref:Polar amino acid transport system substrate-binding protein n=1 Tax=Methanococcus maripaludis TaxID=39152 RepID=A0A7J9P667_METMI|nr:ABC transporter substrate-binding protein [Methanococcus maripaludis]MBA2858672.1 polar amino acid transport system substrate-binding protein [Methanococcus maripaludis]